MTREEAEIKAAIGYIENQLRDGYIDLNFIDEVEMDIIVCALEQYKQQRWIPVSERLPEEEKDVLVTRKFLGCKDGSHGWNNHIPPKIYVEVANRTGDEWSALSDEFKIARSRHTDPVAWMPLPDPWKGEKDDD